jgi:hypothetical protein
MALERKAFITRFEFETGVAFPYLEFAYSDFHFKYGQFFVPDRLNTDEQQSRFQVMEFRDCTNPRRLGAHQNVKMQNIHSSLLQMQKQNIKQKRSIHHCRSLQRKI